MFEFEPSQRPLLPPPDDLSSTEGGRELYELNQKRDHEANRLNDLRNQYYDAVDNLSIYGPDGSIHELIARQRALALWLTISYNFIVGDGEDRLPGSSEEDWSRVREALSEAARYLGYIDEKPEREGEKDDLTDKQVLTGSPVDSLDYAADDITDEVAQALEDGELTGSQAARLAKKIATGHVDLKGLSFLISAGVINVASGRDSGRQLREGVDQTMSILHGLQAVQGTKQLGMDDSGEREESEEVLSISDEQQRIGNLLGQIGKLAVFFAHMMDLPSNEKSLVAGSLMHSMASVLEYEKVLEALWGGEDDVPSLLEATKGDVGKAVDAILGVSAGVVLAALSSAYHQLVLEHGDSGSIGKALLVVGAQIDEEIQRLCVRADYMQDQLDSLPPVPTDEQIYHLQRKLSDAEKLGDTILARIFTLDKERKEQWEDFWRRYVSGEEQQFALMKPDMDSAHEALNQVSPEIALWLEPKAFTELNDMDLQRLFVGKKVPTVRLFLPDNMAIGNIGYYVLSSHGPVYFSNINDGAKELIEPSLVFQIEDLVRQRFEQSFMYRGHDEFQESDFFRMQVTNGIPIIGFTHDKRSQSLYQKHAKYRVQAPIRRGWQRIDDLPRRLWEGLEIVLQMELDDPAFAWNFAEHKFLYYLKNIDAKTAEYDTFVRAVLSDKTLSPKACMVLLNGLMLAGSNGGWMMNAFRAGDLAVCTVRARSLLSGLSSDYVPDKVARRIPQYTEVVRWNFNNYDYYLPENEAAIRLHSYRHRQDLMGGYRIWSRCDENGFGYGSPINGDIDFGFNKRTYVFDGGDNGYIWIGFTRYDGKEDPSFTTQAGYTKALQDILDYLKSN